MVDLIMLMRKLWITLMVLWKSKPDEPIIYVIGDSWTNLTLIDVGKPIDIIDWLKKTDHKVVDAATPSYRIVAELEHKIYRWILRFNKSRKIIFLIFLGGNDLLINSAEELLNNTNETTLKVINDLFLLITSIRNHNANKSEIKFVVHGYDYLNASVLSKFFWKGSLTEKFEGYSDDQINENMKKVIDVYNEYLKEYSKENDVEYIDLRNTLMKGDYWEDIHPDPNGARKLAIKILHELVNRPSLKGWM